MRRSRNRFSRRLLVLGVIAGLGVSVIGYRMVRLGLVHGGHYASKVRDITCYESTKMAYRGPILDRHGTVLATSVAASRVALRRLAYSFDAGHAELLAPLLEVDAAELAERLENEPRDFVWLSKGVGVDEANSIRRLGINGIDVHKDQGRSYPAGRLASHILGFSGTEANGLEGLELAFDKEIRGKPAAVRICRDGRGGAFLNEADRRGVNRGAEVHLTIDATLQSIVETELRARVAATNASAGSAVVLDPGTGAVLALANVPDFDPNDFGGFDAASRRDRSVTDQYEPGSTLKPFIVAGALEERVTTKDTVFHCENGTMNIGKWFIHDHNPHAELAVSDVIRLSSNICMAKIGALLGPHAAHRYLTSFGFGSRTGVELPGEVKGLLHPPDAWRDIRTATISYGQGIAVTALQLASGYATLANDGVRQRPYIVSRIVDHDGRTIAETKPKTVGRVVSTRVARELTAMLESVVSRRGTAPQARVSGVPVAGKTGTAQKPERGGYSADRWLASFVGYLPADDPELVISVMIDEPEGSHYGGVVAAPAFRRIAEQAVDRFGIQRDSGPVPVRVVPARPRPAPASRPVSVKVPASCDTIPDLRGLSLRAAVRRTAGCGCRLEVRGEGYVSRQRPAPGAPVAGTRVVALELSR